jgi:hypothetical protein
LSQSYFISVEKDQLHVLLKQTSGDGVADADCCSGDNGDAAFSESWVHDKLLMRFFRQVLDRFDQPARHLFESWDAWFT